ncbi:MAG TPA: hypothetical protein VE690_11505 [Rhodopila sp.]|nr:hypothetical protein [Rhodopila sp.]
MKLPDPGDYMKLGTLIEAWSTGDQPIPRSMQEFKDQLEAHGITAHITETAFIPILYDENTLVMKIPSAQMLARIREPGSWPLPEFYDKVYEGPRKDSGNELYTAVNIERFGDYSITNCG